MTDDMLSYAIKYAGLGWHVFPVTSPQRGDGKAPLIDRWPDRASITKEQIEHWWKEYPDANIGVVTGQRSGIYVLDNDAYKDGGKSFHTFITMHSPLPNTVTSLTGRGGYQYFFLSPENQLRNNTGGLGENIDFRGDGGYVVVPPSHHKSGNFYKWETGRNPFDMVASEIPEWLIGEIRKPRPRLLTLTPESLPIGVRNNELFLMACKLRDAGFPQSAIILILGQYNQNYCQEPLPQEEIEAIAKSSVSYPVRGELTEDRIADSWIELHPNIAYGLNEFMNYETGIWQKIDENIIEREILLHLQTLKPNGIKPTAAKKRSIKEIVRPKVFIETEKWDANPDNIIFRNGSLNLTDFELYEPNKYDYATISLPYDYDEKASTEKWKSFLESILPEDKIQFLQEFAGYCLTIDTKHELSVWLLGPSGSGKSTFITGIRAMLGGKAGVLGLHNIEESKFSLDGIQGKTLLTFDEQATGIVKRSNIINSLISGEPIKIERKYKDGIEIIPKAKIIWAMNKLPFISEPGDGLLRRRKIVTFPSPSFSPNPMLKEELKQERQGILLWALEGLKRLQQRGHFAIPISVENATNDSNKENDRVGRFLVDCCIKKEYGEIQSQILYEKYTDWCNKNGLDCPSQVWFAKVLQSIGLTKREKSGRQYWKGIALKSE